MRDIEFRGILRGTNVWVYGNLVQTVVDGAKKVFIISKERAEYSEFKDGCPALCFDENNYVFSVDPDSIGQFVGRKDKNGVKLFENDIVEYMHKFDIKYIGIVKIKDGCFVIDWKFTLKGWNKDFKHCANKEEIAYWRCYGELFDATPLGEINSKIQIIGNVFDNPDLLKKIDCWE